MPAAQAVRNIAAATQSLELLDLPNTVQVP